MAENRRMKAARAWKGLTQRDLAEQVGLQESDLSRIETGRTTPSPELKRRIAEVLDKSVIKLFDA